MTNKHLRMKMEQVESIIKDKVGTMSPKEIKNRVKCELNSDYTLERYFFNGKLFLEVELILRPKYIYRFIK